MNSQDKLNTMKALRILRKYGAILVVNLKEALTYRNELVLWSLIDAMPLVAALVLWLAAFGQYDSIAGYTQASLVAYYISGYIFQDLTGSHFDEDVIREIQSGKVATDLVKPISLRRFLVVREIPWRIMGFVFSVLPVLVLVFIVAGDMMPSVKLIHFLVLPIFLGLAYLLESVYSLMVVAMGFVFEEARSLTHLKWMLGWLFSGSMMPFEFMPDWLARVASWLPFRFRYYVPIQIYFGKVKGLNLIYQLGLEIIWVVILIWLLRWLWSRNLKKFTAVGN